MAEYFIPADASESEFVEKRSRFIGHVWPVETEAEARACIDAMKKRYHDARHNCWCYRIKEGGIERYSDDGEPQGTAGQPMLNVFQKEEMQNVCCVVTRYFGGILLGAGGLVRAYTQGAKNALDAAGKAQISMCITLSFTVDYGHYEQAQRICQANHVHLKEPAFTDQVTLSGTILAGTEAPIVEGLRELSRGSIQVHLSEPFCGAF